MLQSCNSQMLPRCSWRSKNIIVLVGHVVCCKGWQSDCYYVIITRLESLKKMYNYHRKNRLGAACLSGLGREHHFKDYFDPVHNIFHRSLDLHDPFCNQ